MAQSSASSHANDDDDDPQSSPCTTVLIPPDNAEQFLVFSVATRPFLQPVRAAGLEDDYSRAGNPHDPLAYRHAILLTFLFSQL